MIQILFLLVINTGFLLASECSPYYNPQRFIEADDALSELFENHKIDDKIKEFDIIKKELYNFRDEEIASEINDSFGELWHDWIEDGYEMQLYPEQTLLHYKGNYFSLSVFIYGVIGDATRLKGTEVKYSFYNYANEVEKHISCINKTKN